MRPVLLFMGTGKARVDGILLKKEAWRDSTVRSDGTASADVSAWHGLPFAGSAWHGATEEWRVHGGIGD